MLTGRIWALDGRAHADPPDRTDRRIDEQLQPVPPAETEEGLGAAIVIDVSGSMQRPVDGVDGRRDDARSTSPAGRLAIWSSNSRGMRRTTATSRCSSASTSSASGTDSPIAGRSIPMGAPDRQRADAALARLRADGGTPIGNAMIGAKRELDRTGLSRRHLLVVTDGENTNGFAPDRVAAAIGRRPETERPSIYFVAFDIAANRFNSVREAGGLVLPASNARDLNETLDMLLRGKISDREMTVSSFQLPRSFSFSLFPFIGRNHPGGPSVYRECQPASGGPVYLSGNRAFPLTALVCLVLSAAAPVDAQSPPQKPAVSPANDLDAFMEKALARREVNRKMLNQYVLDETEAFEILGPGALAAAPRRSATSPGTSATACTSAAPCASTA